MPTATSAAVTQPKRVLFLARLFWPHVGGVEKHLAKLIEQLPASDYTITIITEQYDDSLLLQEMWHGCHIIRIPVTKLTSKIGLWSWILKNAQLFWSADIIHIHDVFWWQLPLSPFLIHKSYITFHGYEGVEAPRLTQRWWHQLAALFTRANLCIGGFHKKWYGVTPTVTSFGAVDMKELHYKSSSTASVASHSPNKKIIFLGRLAEDTGCLTYLHGFHQFTKNESGWQLDIYGDGPQRTACEQYAKKHNMPVTFYGFIENAASKITSYQVALVSRHLAILEALAVGVPVIAHYNNRIKKDYLLLSPFAEWVTSVHTAEEVAVALQSSRTIPTAASNWAQSQTWAKLAATYKKLWA